MIFQFPKQPYVSSVLCVFRLARRVLRFNFSRITIRCFRRHAVRAPSANRARLSKTGGIEMSKWSREMGDSFELLSGM